MSLTLPRLKPIAGPAAWYGEDILKSGRGVLRLSPTAIAEIDSALAKVSAMRLIDIAREDFPLPGLASDLAGVAEELENGSGFVRIKGFPPGRYSDEEHWKLYWGIATHLGVPVHQNPVGRLYGEVRDESKRKPDWLVERNTLAKDGEGTVTNQARVSSTGPLRFHTDLCDVVGLYCVRNAATGGVSKVASSITVYNEILKRRPDLAEILTQDFTFARPEGHVDPDGNRLYVLPVFGIEGDLFTSAYSRVYVEMAQDAPGVKRLTAAQNEALDMLAAVAEEVCFRMEFEAGEFQFLNNHVIYHGRTGFTDSADGGRLLYRLWLSTPTSRRLPGRYAVLYGRTEPGAVRGGVQRKHIKLPLGDLVSPAYERMVAAANHAAAVRA